MRIKCLLQPGRAAGPLLLVHGLFTWNETVGCASSALRLQRQGQQFMLEAFILFDMHVSKTAEKMWTVI